MDKQIIIDNVDVSGCAERSMCINCETVTNCYYKQLKRKEQQYEKINEEYNTNIFKLGEMVLKNSELYNKLKAKE